MTGGKKENSKARLKRAAKGRLEDGAEAQEAALQAGKRKRQGKDAGVASAAPWRMGRPQWTRG